MKPFLSLLALLTLAVSKVDCALPYISSLDIKNNADRGLRLISLSDDEEPSWKTEAELMELKRVHIPFVDVTDVYDTWRRLPNRQPMNRLVDENAIQIKYPEPSFQNELQPILTNVSIPAMRDNLETLTSFKNRWYLSATGLDASHWIFNKAQEIVYDFDRDDVVVSLYNHTFPQPSIIARIPGEEDGPLTILGCHMDSVNLNDPLNGTAPGADDDGSGVVNVLEVLRSLLAAGFQPATPVEFHWYAAEEAGLRGSAAIATDYKQRGVEVQGFMQLDMTGYYKPGTDEVIALLPDYVDENLNDFVKSLVEEYNRIPWVMEEPCHYGCSDHFSWDKVGYPATFPFEAVTRDYNPEMHTTEDTTLLDGFSWEHSLEFAKLGVAFIYELAASSDWRQ
ncbi:aminopeptidase [Coprinopsis cinerea AmutBmut pab1-1]|nr:aminopeptidase [Coprinopsis cinerea AmutBmut pab1-1]